MSVSQSTEFNGVFCIPLPLSIRYSRYIELFGDPRAKTRFSCLNTRYFRLLSHASAPVAGAIKVGNTPAFKLNRFNLAFPCCCCFLGSLAQQCPRLFLHRSSPSPPPLIVAARNANSRDKNQQHPWPRLPEHRVQQCTRLQPLARSTKSQMNP